MADTARNAAFLGLAVIDILLGIGALMMGEKYPRARLLLGLLCFLLLIPIILLGAFSLLPIETPTESSATIKLLRTELSDACHSVAWIELSGFSPNSSITVTSNASDLNCDTGEWNTREWTQVYDEPTDASGDLVIAYNLGRGDYNYTFTDENGQTESLSFSIKP